MAEPEGGVPDEVLIGFPVHEYVAKPADPSTSRRWGDNVYRFPVNVATGGRNQCTSPIWGIAVTACYYDWVCTPVGAINYTRPQKTPQGCS